MLSGSGTLKSRSRIRIWIRNRSFRNHSTGPLSLLYYNMKNFKLHQSAYFLLCQLNIFYDGSKRAKQFLEIVISLTLTTVYFVQNDLTITTKEFDKKQLLSFRPNSFFSIFNIDRFFSRDRPGLFQTVRNICKILTYTTEQE